MSGVDVRTTPPVWVRYAEYIGGGSDKFYEARVDLDDDGRFVLTARWGRRPDQGAGQIKVYDRVRRMQMATAQAEALFQTKLDKGYVACERPLAANRQVPTDVYDEDDY